jgi:ABC-type uncharacterized transport system substrate-binding protein
MHGLHQMDQHLKSVASSLLVAFLVLVSGCVVAPPPVLTQTPPRSAPAPVKKPAPLEAPKPAPTNVAIILSDSKPAYQNVASELAQRLPKYSVYNLANNALPANKLMSIIAATKPDAVVAIGLRAAIAATSNSELPVVFCQVFNFTGRQLISDRFKGVASIPPLELQIQAWKQLNPELSNVGAILGTGHELLIDEAATATTRHDVTLHHRTAKSDRETLYLFHQLLPHIDGFWLFPDNRVLSPPVLRQMLADASHHDIQVAVFNESLLKLGATMSATALASDIAATIVSVVDQFEHDAWDSIPDMTPLTEVTIRTGQASSQDNSQKLGLNTVGVQSISETEGPH